MYKRLVQNITMENVTIAPLGPKGPQNKSLMFWVQWGLVYKWYTNVRFNTSQKKMYPPNSWAKRVHKYRASYSLGAVMIGAQMLGSAQTSQYPFFFSQVNLLVLPPAGVCI